MVLLFTKKEAASPCISATSPQTEKSTASSPKSAIGKLCRKLSPRKNDAKRPLALTPQGPYSGPFERVFQYFDSDGDGKISPAELRSCTKSLGEELSVEDAEAVVEANDSDGDGLLGLDDFMRLMEVEGEEERRKDLVEAFGMYKMEGQGCITPKSLKRMLSRLGESKTIDECKTMISRFDIDGDGVLSFEEFTVMMV
ncbi:putative calcium-binding protein CML19 [Aristolochia californica]|uniref:putative calcium-binding protein CML19 n=1 Tax=Aristolochia californica TaxID=171875 RepID=UPI0035E01CDD